MQIRKKVIGLKWLKLALAASLVGFLASLLAISLKHVTEHYEEIFFRRTEKNSFLLLILPFIGLSVIYFLRLYLFKNKENKGIKEVFESTKPGKSLPAYKIPSHFINGLITVAFGGSTGIEVSTVVASAAVGSIAHSKESFLKKYKTELICAGVAAGVAALFASPIAGLLFAYEVISKKLSKSFLFVVAIAVGVAGLFLFFLDEKPLFAVGLEQWHYHAIPYFILLGIVAGLNSVYLTKCVLKIKSLFLKIQTPYYRVVLGAVIVGIGLFAFPQLFGDGYHTVKENIITSHTAIPAVSVLLTLAACILLKPVMTSVTLSSGGDGGVFAPSIFIGALLGLLFAFVSNRFFDAGVIPLNFMVIGMAAMLSASISAPFTALFLVCGLVGSYVLFWPILVVSLVSRYVAQKLCPYTVYTYVQKTV
ncbi:CIC family chloride channel protein [Flavobacterium endophyticum]|uniref:CIC family chloride channel protein n=1 Tax=Flavobacterium endophyticum TaxID=1540163 RepID=A0A495M4Y9_9FLAO|nr:chloride channel protein [Flavobacterium endophyticum]RKS20385.1 CIC family chloride channel protein [Flavobacterium endophyticum]